MKILRQICNVGLDTKLNSLLKDQEDDYESSELESSIERKVSSVIIKNKTKLPITGVRFGPHKYEIQKANIIVGPLECKEQDEEPLSVKDKIDDIEEKP